MKTDKSFRVKYKKHWSTTGISSHWTRGMRNDIISPAVLLLIDVDIVKTGKSQEPVTEAFLELDK